MMDLPLTITVTSSVNFKFWIQSNPSSGLGGFDWSVDDLGWQAKTKKQDNDLDVCFEIIYALY